MDKYGELPEWVHPNWLDGGRVHNWRNYINDPLKTMWLSFTLEQRKALRDNAQEIADREE
jgi:hypothetical protein